MNVRAIKGHSRLLLFLGLTVAAALLFGILDLGAIHVGRRTTLSPTSLILLLVVGYLLLRLATGPLPRLIARIGYSVRWKILVAVCLMAVLFSFVSIINFVAMDYMHNELHDIQDVGPSEIIPAVDALEDLNHGLLFDNTPFLALLGVEVGLALGAAVALSVIDPLRRMHLAMRRIAAGDFSQPIQVDNRDELGELAGRINQTAKDLAKLQEATLADERARALRERITQVTLAQEEERRRISRELHDGLGPSLAALGNRLRACQRIVRSDPQQAESELEEITRSLKGHVQDIRRLIHDLRPLAVDQLGLRGALQQRLERFSQETGIQVYSDMSGDVALGPIAEVTVFRVVQECLSNVQKHANASQVEVKLQGTKTGVEVCVQDNGQGFDPDAGVAGAMGEGVGLLSMEERAKLVGGRLSVESSPGNGCQVTLHIPSKEAEVGVHTNLVS